MHDELLTNYNSIKSKDSLDWYSEVEIIAYGIEELSNIVIDCLNTGDQRVDYFVERLFEDVTLLKNKLNKK